MIHLAGCRRTFDSRLGFGVGGHSTLTHDWEGDVKLIPDRSLVPGTVWLHSVFLLILHLNDCACYSTSIQSQRCIGWARHTKTLACSEVCCRFCWHCPKAEWSSCSQVREVRLASTYTASTLVMWQTVLQRASAHSIGRSPLTRIILLPDSRCYV